MTTDQPIGPTSQSAAHKWQPITDLPEGLTSMDEGELRALQRLWSDQRSKLADGEAVKEFNARLVREWCIETGILESLYTLDRGVTQTLVEQGIDAALIPHGASDLPAHQLVEILRDHHEAIE